MKQINKKNWVTRARDSVFTVTVKHIERTEPSAPDDIQENMAYGNFLS